MRPSSSTESNLPKVWQNVCVTVSKAYGLKAGRYNQPTYTNCFRYIFTKSRLRFQPEQHFLEQIIKPHSISDIPSQTCRLVLTETLDLFSQKHFTVELSLVGDIYLSNRTRRVFLLELEKCEND